MRAVVLTSIMAFVALSGCFGLPEGSADYGDQVEISYVAVDPETGALLASRLDNAPTYEEGGIVFYDGVGLFQTFTSAGGDAAFLQGFLVESTAGFEPVEKAVFDKALVDSGHVMDVAATASFVVGSGMSGLGMDLERGVVGRMVNDTFQIESTDDASRGFTDTVTRPVVIDSLTLTDSIPLEQYTPQLGDPEIGFAFQFDQGGFVEATVTGFDNSSVQVSLAATGEVLERRDLVGADVTVQETSNTLEYVLVPAEGARFMIRAAPGMRTPLDMPPGSYETVGIEGDDIVWRYSTLQRPSLMEVPVTFHVSIDGVERVPVELDPDNYGVRDSPVLLPTKPHTHGDAMPAGSMDDHHDDGPDDHHDDGPDDHHDDGHQH